MLRGGMAEPVLTAPGIVQDRRDALGRESVGALPAHLGAEAGAALREVPIERRAPEAPGRLEFPVGPTHRVVQAEGFAHALAQPAVVAVELERAPYVHRTQTGRVSGGARGWQSV